MNKIYSFCSIDAWCPLLTGTRSKKNEEEKRPSFCWKTRRGFCRIMARVKLKLVNSGNMRNNWKLYLYSLHLSIISNVVICKRKNCTSRDRERQKKWTHAMCYKFHSVIMSKRTVTAHRFACRYIT